MSTDTEAVRVYFAKLGLEPEIADIYLALHAYGRQTISELSRNSKVERTRIYRLLDTLKESHLVESEVQYKREILKPAPITNLQILLTKKEQELLHLKSELRDIHRVLQNSSMASPLTHVQFYRGDGLKQMFWNQTKTKTEMLTILYENLQFYAKSAFFERWVRAFNEKAIPARGIIGDHFIETQQKWYKQRKNERLANWHSRFVPDKVFHITHSTLIYDDVVAYYNWKGGEIFGIEIYNQEIADAQRQFFETLWTQGKEVTVKLGDEEAMP